MTQKNKKNAIQTMKAAELSMAERKAGLSLATLEDPNYPKADLLIALGWVIAKRDNPTLTFEDYGFSKTLEEITEELGLGE
ncbi:hypothetical protein [Rhodococcus opacus]|uniref:hypothetical protein n=1 Tax=Rhodococcus opacus TaxID=37919 RepID=UPI000AA2C52B|nr:hypothetical protein [Rhodococcus opacus]